MPQNNGTKASHPQVLQVDPEGRQSVMQKMSGPFAESYSRVGRHPLVAHFLRVAYCSLVAHFLRAARHPLVEQCPLY